MRPTGGCYFVNANSNTAPQIVDQRVRPILDRSEIYSGVYARCVHRLLRFSTRTATAAWPAGWATSRRSATANRSAARAMRRTSSPRWKTTISLLD